MSRDRALPDLAGWLTSVAPNRHRPYLLSIFERDSVKIRELLALGVTAKALWEAFRSSSPGLGDVSLWTFTKALADWRKARGITRQELAPAGPLPAPLRRVAPLPRPAPPAPPAAAPRAPAPVPPPAGRPVDELHSSFLNQVVLPAVESGQNVVGLGGLPHVNPAAHAAYQRPEHPMERQFREAEEARTAAEAAAQRRLSG